MKGAGVQKTRLGETGGVAGKVGRAWTVRGFTAAPSWLL